MIISTLLLTGCSFPWEKEESAWTNVPAVKTETWSTVQKTNTWTVTTDKITTEKVDWLTLSWVVIKKIDNKEIKVIRMNKWEKPKDYLTRVWLSDLDTRYITQYEMYVNSKMNWYPAPEIYFMEKNISVEFDKDYNISKVNKLNKITITKEQYLEKNQSFKTQILALNDKMKIETNKQLKEELQSQLKSLVDSIPTSDIEKIEFKMDKYPTFVELLKQVSASK